MDVLWGGLSLLVVGGASGACAWMLWAVYHPHKRSQSDAIGLQLRSDDAVVPVLVALTEARLQRIQDPVVAIGLRSRFEMAETLPNSERLLTLLEILFDQERFGEASAVLEPEPVAISAEQRERSFGLEILVEPARREARIARIIVSRVQRHLVAMIGEPRTRLADAGPLPESDELWQAWIEDGGFKAWLTRLVANLDPEVGADPLQSILERAVRDVGRAIPLACFPKLTNAFPAGYLISERTYAAARESLWRPLLSTQQELEQARIAAIQADRLVAMGLLVAGIAHEINNPLAAIIGNLDSVAADLKSVTSISGERLRDCVELVDDSRVAADRVRLVVRELKIFSRVDEESRGPIDVHQVLESTVKIVWNEIRHRSRLVKDFQPVPLVDADETRLSQVIVNLLINAAHAIGDGYADRNEIRLVTRTTASRVVIEVHDTGCGIPKETLGQIFDPFYTTKPKGVGTGLGLSICHNIVTGLGGELSVESELGKGTMFRIVLPPSARSAISSAAPAPAPVAAGRRGKVLVIDDDDQVRKTLQRFIAKEHDVVAVASAQEALAQVVAGDPFDIIFCDLMMPGMTGMDLHRELASIAPAASERMVFVTGGAFTVQAQTFLDAVPNQRIEKPFDRSRIQALIRERLP